MSQGNLVMTDVSKAEFDALKSRLDSACDDVSQIKKDTADIIDTFKALAGGFKVLQALGKMARVVTFIAASVAAVVAAWQALTGGIGK